MRSWIARTYPGTALLTFLALLLPFSVSASDASALELRRGVGIHHMLNWAATVSPHRGEPVDSPYKFPPFQDSKYQTDDRLIAAIGSSGMDFVRLTVDPGPFLYFRGNQRDELDAILVDRVKRFRSAGLKVVVDFHPNQQHRIYNPEAYESGSGLFPDYVTMIGRTARVLSGHFQDGVALEPFNEPQTGYRLWEIGMWDRMQNRLVDAIRKESKTLPIIVTGGQGGGLEGLLALDPVSLAADPNVFFSFHYYLPYEFTHQTATWGRPEWQYMSQIPYPADGRKLADALNLTKARIDSEAPVDQRAKLKSNLEKALAAYPLAGTPDAIRADFGKAAAWANEYGIEPARIFLGEFGSAGNGRTGKDRVPDTDRLRWLSDIRSAAENAGFGWSIWVLKDDSFGLVDPKNPDALDAPQLKALGLSTQGR